MRVKKTTLLSWVVACSLCSMGVATVAGPAEAATGTTSSEAVTTLIQAPSSNAPLSAWQSWAADQRNNVTSSTVSQVVSSSLVQGCTLVSAQAVPVTSNGQHGVPAGVTFNVGVWSANCTAAIATLAPGASAGTTSLPPASPDTTGCPLQSSGFSASAYDGYVCIGVSASNSSDLEASYLNTTSNQYPRGTLSFLGGNGSTCTGAIATLGPFTASPGYAYGIQYSPTASNYYGSSWSLGGKACGPF
jgi:hypothetical protein